MKSVTESFRKEVRESVQAGEHLLSRVEALKPSANLGAMVGGGASGATSRITVKKSKK